MEANERDYSPEEEYIDLRQYWLVLKRRWPAALIVLAASIAAAAIHSSRQVPLFEAKAKLLIQDGGARAITAIGSGGDLGGSRVLSNEAEIIRSLPIAEQAIEELDLKMRPKFLISKLTVRRVGDTNILELAYESPSPERAAEVVNTLMEVYRAYDIDTNRSEATAARQFIEEQLPQTEVSVLAAEEALRQFKEENSIISLSQEASSTVSLLSGLDRNLIETRANLEEVEERLSELRSQVGLDDARTALAAGTLSESQAVQRVLTEFQQVEAELALKQTRYRSDHPEIRGLESRQQALQALLQERVAATLVEQQAPETVADRLQLGNLKVGLVQDLVDAEISALALRSRLQTLESERQGYQQRAAILPRLEQKQRELERQLSAAQSTYEALLKRLQEVRVAENQNLGNARVVENALVPNAPFSPRTQLNVILGGVAGLLLGVATAFALDARDRRLKTVQEAQDRLGYTMLGAIPLFSAIGGKEIAARDGDRAIRLPLRDLPRSSLGEAFRMLQANLRFSSSDKPLQVLVITSSVPQEGKSTVSANLGMALAELGNRVLIIDADLRRPSQHQLWERPNTGGLSNVLVGQKSLSEVVQREEALSERQTDPDRFAHLYLMTAGVVPPNPIALIDSQTMSETLDTLKGQYDYILIDTPPLAVAADAAILGKKADGVLLVVRPGVVSLPNVTATKDTLKRSQQPVLGMVVNGVNPANEPDSYYYYYAKDYYTVPDESESLPQQTPLRGR